MKIAIASDHAGFCLKEKIKENCCELDWKDFGTDSEESADYPDTGKPASEAVARGECVKGVLICGSGIGMSIVANKVPGIRAALCGSVEVARLSRMHNDANVLVLAGRLIDDNLAFAIVKTWLETPFEGSRHQRRIDKIEK